MAGTVWQVNRQTGENGMKIDREETKSWALGLAVSLVLNAALALLANAMTRGLLFRWMAGVAP